MKYYIGIDSGGTKTAFMLGDSQGKLRGEKKLGATSYRQQGGEYVAAVLEEGVKALLNPLGVSREEVGGIVIGLSCFGESAQNDAEISELLHKRLFPCPCLITNDVEVGWAGSLGLKAGINIVAGTGSIAFGRDPAGGSARCGGWDEFFSDEGSCHWLGRKALELFSKESDGRLEKGPLYSIVRQHFGLDNDLELIDRVIPEISGCRGETAKLQLLLQQAAQEGDRWAEDAYRRAAKELAMMVLGVKNALDFPVGMCPVSYSGGLFRTGDLILTPFRKELENIECQLNLPIFDPWEGALLLAYEKYGPQSLKNILETLKNEKL